jgi:hypothetical protein
MKPNSPEASWGPFRLEFRTLDSILASDQRVARASAAICACCRLNRDVSVVLIC